MPHEQRVEYQVYFREEIKQLLKVLGVPLDTLWAPTMCFGNHADPTLKCGAPCRKGFRHHDHPCSWEVEVPEFGDDYFTFEEVFDKVVAQSLAESRTNKVYNWFSMAYRPKEDTRRKRSTWYTMKSDEWKMAICLLNIFIDPPGNQYGNPTLQPASSCLLYTSPSPRDVEESRMPSSA